MSMGCNKNTNMILEVVFEVDAMAQIPCNDLLRHKETSLINFFP